MQHIITAIPLPKQHSATYQTISCVYCIISAELQLLVERTSVYCYRYGNCRVLLKYKVRAMATRQPLLLTSRANGLVFWHTLSHSRLCLPVTHKIRSYLISPANPPQNLPRANRYHFCMLQIKRILKARAQLHNQQTNQHRILDSDQVTLLQVLDVVVQLVALVGPQIHTREVLLSNLRICLTFSVIS